jgi:hypothetical protein
MTRDSIDNEGYVHPPQAPGQKRTIAVTGAASGRKLEVRALNADPVSILWKP